MDSKALGFAWNVLLAVIAILGSLLPVGAYNLDLDSQASIVGVARSMAEDMMAFYSGDQPGGTPGILPDPYYWWEGGALMGALVDYWYYTGDARWNDAATQGLLHQVGPNKDYMPPNQTMTEGNDDQGFWGMAVMSAAEHKFPDPPRGEPQWLALAQAVFNTQAARWDERTCGGGLRWQIFAWNNGFGYKNSISQGCFFNLAARLARYTGNQSYAAWASRAWDWMASSGLLDPATYHIYDGVDVDNCSRRVPYQWSYNAGAFLLGAAAMYNHTADAADRDVWRERVDGLLNGTAVFFGGDAGDVMTEAACEPVGLCNVDQQSFKAYLARWMAAATKWAPWTDARVMPLLRASAAAAAAACTGGPGGRLCGLRWTGRAFDGWTGVGQQMAAMEVVLACLVRNKSAPAADGQGGTSVGDPAAGGGEDAARRAARELGPVSAAGKAGAWALTAAAALTLLLGLAFIVVDEGEPWPSWTRRLAAVCPATSASRRDPGVSKPDMARQPPSDRARGWSPRER
ncbi:hypothetical protein VTJ83DRAFT_1652 [Remersonia thermophila]|uniref:mannan endo-1,6-alpha-mannosidase n=1 Tax=Remersonia thermophila TaxID=72144 RepID=A0ABR4DGI4_9PEZI